MPFVIVFTKADKLSRQKVNLQAQSYLNHLKDQWEELPKYFITSATSGMGRDEILNYIDSINQQLSTQ